MFALFKGAWLRHWNGDGGIQELLKVSFPVIVAQASSSLMTFTDRYLLSSLGKVYPTASMAGGFFSWSCTSFFVGLLCYITALVAQYLGAKKKHLCLDVLAQGLLLSLCVVPVLHIIAYVLGPWYFQWCRLPQEEIALAIEYLNMILWGSLFILFNVSFSGYFNGVGRTKVVMCVNLMSLFVNVPLTYYLIHQPYVTELSGVKGAAAATVLSSALACGCFLAILLKEHGLWVFVRKLKGFNREILNKLWVFGGPTGLEFFLAFFAFNLAVTMFHSYGVNEGLAITIALNWDILAFLPLWGLNIGIMSLSGRYLGARRVDLALRTTFSGAKISYSITSLFALGFLLLQHDMVMVFMPEGVDPKDLEYLLTLTKSMLLWVGFYIFAHATVSVFGATLRASGDTRWCMWATIIMDWICCLFVYLSVHVLHYEPLTTWMIFVIGVFIYCLCFAARFAKGHWKNLQVV